MMYGIFFVVLLADVQKVSVAASVAPLIFDAIILYRAVSGSSFSASYGR